MESQYLASLAKLGFLSTEATVDDILDLNVRDLMERRLQTMVFRNGLSKSIHQARQLVTHGHISIAGRIVTVPGYIVRKNEETHLAFHGTSPLSNPQHPARGQPSGRQGEKPTQGRDEASQPREPELPAVSKEIAEEVEAEKPLESSAVEEPEGAEGEQKP